MRADPSPKVRERAGFTIIELLIASAVIAIVLGATTALLAQSYRAYQLNQQLSERQQEIEGAVKILSYDVALAGYRGNTLTDVARTFDDPTIQVFTGGASAGEGASDRLVVRYFEDTDRLFGGTDACGSPCVVTYDVDDDGGTLLLYRQEGTSEERGIVQEVESFRVLQYITRAGQPCTFGALEEGCPAFPNDLAGLNIEIRFTNGGTWRFPVGITNAQNP
jgi:prepilin-type N-terminal cleavage/methylation domain-containing protein